MRVLVAEVDTVLLLILKTALEQAGHECVTAETGVEAWNIIDAAPVEVVISDWMMPGLNGVELCRRLRADTQKDYVYFIFLTAPGELSELRVGMEAGADDYLLKPLNRAELALRLMVAERITRLHAQLTDQARELQCINRRLAEQGRTDPLTQLGNRLRLDEDLRVLAARATRYGHRCCAAMCDVDHFKRYNDTHGHAAGDEVLRQVAAAIRNAARTEDGVYRYGGEEFLLLLPTQSIATATLVVERVRESVEALGIPLDAYPSPDVVSISAGVAALAAGPDSGVERMLADADAALYRAKAAGRNNVQVAHPRADGEEGAIHSVAAATASARVPR